MTDNLSRSDRRKTMRAVKGKNTSPERRLKASLAGSKISGWCMHPSNITGHPDFVFIKEKIAIFVDGCFWHGCPICSKPLPKSNNEYWTDKIRRNIERDNLYSNELEKLGWHVIRIWTHEIRKKEDLKKITERIRDAMKENEEKML